MKRNQRLLRLSRAVIAAAMVVLSMQAARADVEINAENFPDENFRENLKEIDPNKDGKFSEEEIANLTELYVYYYGVSSVKGIEYFTALEHLWCHDSSGLTSLDVSSNTNLKYLDCRYTGITELDVSKNLELEYLNCSYCGIKELDVSANIKLDTLDCSGNEIQNVDVTSNTRLVYLDCSNNKLKEINVSKNLALYDFYCSGNEIESLDLSNNKNMRWMDCSYNRLGSLDVSEHKRLVTLNCSENQLMSLDLTNNTELTNLYFYGNHLTCIDLSNNPEIISCQGYNERDVEVNYRYEKDGKTYYYIDMTRDERAGKNGNELQNKLGEGFNATNVLEWYGATVETTPAGTTALVWEDQIESITYTYNVQPGRTEPAEMPSHGENRAVIVGFDGTMMVTLNLKYDDVTTAVEDVEAGDAVRIYAANGVISIDGSEEESRVIDTMGRSVYIGREREISVPAGLYIVKVGTVTKKVAVR